MSFNDITKDIIGCAFKVHNALGAGFLEKVYENALGIELRKLGFTVVQQYPVPVYYEGVQVGDYVADILVNNILVELKAVENLHPKHEAQLVNYLTATKIDIGLLINFGSSVEVKRKYREYKKVGNKQDLMD